MDDFYCIFCLYDDRPGEVEKRKHAITVCNGYATCEEHLAWPSFETFMMHLADDRAHREGHSERLDTPPARRQLPESVPGMVDG